MSSFNPITIIERKRDGGTLTETDIRAFIAGFSSGEIPDYQMSALAMAIFLQGMTAEETAFLTVAMLDSGGRLNFADDGRAVVDKHSTGGVGDKASLLVAPLLACFDCKVPMLSGRGLGMTGGTLDKLESIPGFRADLGESEIIAITDRVGCVICGATEQVVPADHKLYALRDVTGTVGSVPLITASILSKKLATSPQALLFDVKCGSGALMKTHDNARTLAHSLVNTASQLGTPARAMITNMNQPLGCAVGNAVEVDEAVSAMQSGAPKDLVELSITLAAELLSLAGRPTATSALRAALTEGPALAKFEEMIRAQHGRLAELPTPQWTEVRALNNGYVAAIACDELGILVAEMGAGRQRQDDPVDHGVGVRLDVKVGDRVTHGQPIGAVAHPEASRYTGPVANLLKTVEDPVSPPSQVFEVIS